MGEGGIIQKQYNIWRSIHDGVLNGRMGFPLKPGKWLRMRDRQTCKTDIHIQTDRRDRDRDRDSSSTRRDSKDWARGASSKQSPWANAPQKSLRIKLPELRKGLTFYNF